MHSICQCHSWGCHDTMCSILEHVPHGQFYNAMLTMGPYGSAGLCTMNYTPPQINMVIMTKALFDCPSQCQPHIIISDASNRQCDTCTIDSAFQQQTTLDKIDVKFNKWLLSA